MLNLNEWLGRFFGRGENSKEIAKKRLQFAIVYDKFSVSEEILGALQKDIVEAISRYFVIDKTTLKIDIRKDEEVNALVVNIPILKAVRQLPKTGRPHPA